MNESLRVKCRCPDCRAAPLVVEQDGLHCAACGESFPVARGAPVLIRHDNEVFPIQAYVGDTPGRKGLAAAVARIIPSPSLALGYRKHLRAFLGALVQVEVPE